MFVTDFMPPTDKRIMVVTGHYGSGKTEFSVSLALLLSALENRPYKKIAVVDLDIINPYFRSREREDVLNKAGIEVYAGSFKGEITAELPALSSAIRAPLEDKDCFVIVDVGGNNAGARVLHQFIKYFSGDEHICLTVVNANRPETRDIDGILHHMDSIEEETGIKIDAIVNNTHLIMETSAQTVLKGYSICQQVCEITGKQFWCNCYPVALVDPKQLQDIQYQMPLSLQMRQSWLDK